MEKQECSIFYYLAGMLGRSEAARVANNGSSNQVYSEGEPENSRFAVVAESSSVAGAINRNVRR